MRGIGEDPPEDFQSGSLLPARDVKHFLELFRCRGSDVLGTLIELICQKLEGGLLILARRFGHPLRPGNTSTSA